MKKVIILGSRGFVARSLAENLQDFELKILSSSDLNLESSFQHSSLENSQDATLVICSGLKRSHGENLEVYERNSKISQNLHRLVSQYPFKKVIYLSSCAVYGEDVVHEKISVTQTLTPTSFYGIAKSEAEFLLLKAIQDNLLILRPPTIYGEHSGLESYDPRGFLHKISHNEPLSIWGDGSEKREFLYINDLTSLIGGFVEDSTFGTLNMCSGNSYSFLDVIKACEEVCGVKAQLTFKPRSKDKVDHFFEGLKLAKFTSLQDGIKQIYQKVKS